MIVIKHVGSISLDIVCPHCCLGEGVGSSVCEIIECLDQLIESVTDSELSGLSQSIVSYLGHEHVSFVPPPISERD